MSAMGCIAPRTPAWALKASCLKPAVSSLLKEQLDASHMPFDPYALRAGLTAESWKVQRIAFLSHARRKPIVSGGRGHPALAAALAACNGGNSIGCPILAGSSVLASFSTTLREMASGRGKVATSRQAEDNANSMVQSTRTILGQNPPADPITRTTETIG